MRLFILEIINIYLMYFNRFITAVERERERERERVKVEVEVEHIPVIRQGLGLKTIQCIYITCIFWLGKNDFELTKGSTKSAFCNILITNIQ